MLAKVASVIETARLQIGAIGGDLGEGGLGQDLVGDIVDNTVHDFVNKADVLVFAGCHTRDDLAPGDLGIHDGFAAAASIIDHHDEILHRGDGCLARDAVVLTSVVFLKIRSKSSCNSENQKLRDWPAPRGGAGRSNRAYEFAGAAVTSPSAAWPEV